MNAVILFGARNMKSKFLFLVLGITLILAAFSLGCSHTAANTSTPSVTGTTTLPPASTTTIAPTSTTTVQATSTTAVPTTTTTTTTTASSTTTTSTPPTIATQLNRKINIGGGIFTPSKLTVPAGTEVEFENPDHEAHDLVCDYPFTSTLPGETLFIFKFDKSGTYTYWVSENPNTKGTVTVN
jgi:plastocyanin